jgi:hypothetical protein
VIDDERVRVLVDGDYFAFERIALRWLRRGFTLAGAQEYTKNED